MPKRSRRNLQTADYIRDKMIAITIHLPLNDHEQLKTFAEVTRREPAELAGVLFSDWVIPKIQQMISKSAAQSITPESTAGAATAPDINQSPILTPPRTVSKSETNPPSTPLITPHGDQPAHASSQAAPPVSLPLPTTRPTIAPNQPPPNWGSPAGSAARPLPQPTTDQPSRPITPPERPPTSPTGGTPNPPPRSS